MSVSELLKEEEEVVEEFDVLFDNNQQEDLNDVNIESRSLIKYHVSNQMCIRDRLIPLFLFVISLTLDLSFLYEFSCILIWATPFVK